MASARMRPPRKTAAAQIRRLVVMVKEPHAGRVKTRLAREIGIVAATWFYRHAARATIRRLSRSTCWQTWLAVSPDTSMRSRCWHPYIPRGRQGSGDLGVRMQSIMDWRGPGPIVIVGTDIPALMPRHVREAFRLLGSHDATLGPTPDGGYFLVGLRRTPRILRPFAGVRWSSANARTDTERNLASHPIGHTATVADVDTAAEWQLVRAWSGRVVLPSHAV